ncbi:DUF3570 domain-containing protein [Maribacter arenosus]|uniref:DUF3570 domain-containing protein n=1 Tax=Maribacter arenosus TaxID=1854708 RepID=UPI00293BCEC1|nr:DUF3570 domain-containing protein [Maribacter arenosus]
MISVLLIVLLFNWGFSQDDNSNSYQKRVLETSEIDLLFSFYNQDGENAAVTGGEGTEELTDATSSIVVKMPLNPDDILTVDVGISAYSSASSSNIDPFDKSSRLASPFSASSGASQSDALVHFNPSYEHSSEDRNSVYSAQAYVSSEYDYFSVGFGGGYTRFFNEKNTQVAASFQVFLDKWNPQYPIELRNGFFDTRITGSGTYNPNFTEFNDETRNSYSLSLSVSQILSKRIQGSIFMDLVSQKGLLGTPHQRVYFGDVDDFFIEEFQLADGVEQLPKNRFKIPIGARLNYYLNDLVVLRSYYRYYSDDWGITGHTASLEVPVKLNDKFTLYPNYRFYQQTSADYFYEKEMAVSSLDFYTSDYDLSAFNSHQYGMGLRYKDIFTSAKVFTFGLKTIDFRFNKYDRSDGLSSYIFSLGTTFVGD